MLFKKPDNTPLKHWYSGIFLILLSFVLFWLAWSVAKDRFVLNENVSVAPGVVIEQTHGKQHVVIEFTTKNGDVIRYDQNGGSYEVGEVVKVLYYPEDPKFRTSTDAFWPLWGVPIRILLFGAFALAFGLLSIFKPQYVRLTGDK